MEKIILLWGALILLGVNLGCRQEMVASEQSTSSNIEITDDYVKNWWLYFANKESIQYYYNKSKKWKWRSYLPNILIVKILFTAFSLSMFVSCDQIIDFYNERSKDEASKKYTSPYMGVYVGSFSGGISGDLVINVSKDGYVRGTRTSMNITDDFF